MLSGKVYLTTQFVFPVSHYLRIYLLIEFEIFCWIRLMKLQFCNLERNKTCLRQNTKNETLPIFDSVKDLIQSKVHNVCSAEKLTKRSTVLLHTTLGKLFCGTDVITGKFLTYSPSLIFFTFFSIKIIFTKIWHIFRK